FGASGIAVQAASIAAASADGGKTWSFFGPPSNGVGIAIDGTNPLHAVTGGTNIRITSDGGKSWQPTRTQPPGIGPYQPLGFSPFDPQIWFFVHQGKLLRTRDASLTWRDLGGLPSLSSPVIAPGPIVGEFFVANANRVFQLVDNGQTINELPALPGDVSIAQLRAVTGGQANLFARATNNNLFLLTGTVWTPLAGVSGGPTGAG